MDLAKVLSDVHRDQLSIYVQGTKRPLPAWADWLIWLGLWLRCQAAMDGRRVAVVRLPSRRLAAAFVSLGALLAAARLHDDSLDWDTLKGLAEGTTVHWRHTSVGKSTRYAGTVGSVQEMAGSECLAIFVQSPKRHIGSTFFLPKATALSYGVSLGAVSARSDIQLASAAQVLSSVTNDPSYSWVRSPDADSTLVTEGTSFLADLSDLALISDQREAVPFLDTLAVASASSRQHCKLQLIAPRADHFRDISGGLTVLDGAAAALRIEDAQARSVVLLLDYSEYDEELMNVISPFIGSSIDAGIHVPPDGVLAPPKSVEVFVIGVSGEAEVHT